jgi:site-specific DNA-cytosine methylase
MVRLPDGRERVLQLTEAALLQGFPADYVFVGAFSRAWKMVAQAIQVDMGRALLEGIVREANHQYGETS